MIIIKKATNSLHINLFLNGDIMSIGERIAELRKEQNLSQVQLADAMEVSRQAVSKWETDQSSPDSLNLIKLAQILDTDIEYLTTGRRNYGRRPPVVIKTVETVEKVVEKPVIQVVEKVVEVEKPVVQIVEKKVPVKQPVIQKVVRTKYKQEPFTLLIVGAVSFAVGLILGLLL